MDPAEDCIIKLNTPIRCQEHNALIILQLSEENSHQRIVSTMIRCTLLHKCICLVQEEHGFEVMSDLEYSLKLLFKRIRISVVDDELACRYLRKLVKSPLAPRLARTE